VPVFARQFQCISIDHRGFGQSPDTPDGPGSRAFVEDLRKLLDHLHVDRAALVAQSMGGRTCLGFTLAHPDRVQALVLADTTGGFSDSQIAQMRADMEQRLAGDTSPRTYSRGFAQEHPRRAFLYEQIRTLNPPRSDTPGPGPTAEQIRAMRTPTLLIVGEEDVITQPAMIEAFQQYIPHARLRRVAGSGHSVYFEKPDEFNRIVLEFLADVGA
jgi:pimeloyl-ACP methyl ester carboxylesterase